MRIVISCPSCGATVKVLVSAAGKRIACPRCANAISVPAAVENDSGFEVVDDEPVAASRPPKATVVKAKIVAGNSNRNEQLIGRPRPGDSWPDDGETDVRPRKRPSRKPARTFSTIPIWIPVAGGIGLLVMIGIAALALIPGGGGGRVIGLGPPAGYSVIKDAGIRIYSYGKASGHFARLGGPDGPITPDHYFASTLVS